MLSYHIEMTYFNHSKSKFILSNSFVVKSEPISPQAQRARGKLIREVRESFNVDAFIGNATDWEKVCLGNLVGMPVIVVPTGYANISASPPSGTRRRRTVTTGIYAPPQKDHIVSFLWLDFSLGVMRMFQVDILFFFF